MLREISNEARKPQTETSRGGLHNEMEDEESEGVADSSFAMAEIDRSRSTSKCTAEDVGVLAFVESKPLVKVLADSRKSPDKSDLSAADKPKEDSGADES